MCVNAAPLKESRWIFLVFTVVKFLFSKHDPMKRCLETFPYPVNQIINLLKDSCMKLLCRQCFSSPGFFFTTASCITLLPFVTTSFYCLDMGKKICYTCVTWENGTRHFCTSVSAIDQSIRAFFTLRCSFCCMLCPVCMCVYVCAFCLVVLCLFP